MWAFIKLQSRRVNKSKAISKVCNDMFICYDFYMLRNLANGPRPSKYVDSIRRIQMSQHHIKHSIKNKIKIHLL